MLLFSFRSPLSKRCNKGIQFHQSVAAQLCSTTLFHCQYWLCLNIFSLTLTMSCFLSDCLLQLLVFSKTFSNGGTVDLVVQGNIFQMRVSKLNKLRSNCKRFEVISGIMTLGQSKINQQEDILSILMKLFPRTMKFVLWFIPLTLMFIHIHAYTLQLFVHVSDQAFQTLSFLWTFTIGWCHCKLGQIKDITEWRCFECFNRWLFSTTVRSKMWTRNGWWFVKF